MLRNTKQQILLQKFFFGSLFCFFDPLEGGRTESLSQLGGLVDLLRDLEEVGDAFEHGGIVHHVQGLRSGKNEEKNERH